MKLPGSGGRRALLAAGPFLTTTERTTTVGTSESSWRRCIQSSIPMSVVYKCDSDKSRTQSAGCLLEEDADTGAHSGLVRVWFLLQTSPQLERLKG
jgi:hypothetical protein